MNGFAHDAELSVLMACQNGTDVMQVLGAAELCLQCGQMDSCPILCGPRSLVHLQRIWPGFHVDLFLATNVFLHIRGRVCFRSFQMEKNPLSRD